MRVSSAQEHVDNSLFWTEMLDLAAVVRKIKFLSVCNHVAVRKIYMQLLRYFYLWEVCFMYTTPRGVCKTMLKNLHYF
jgi:hypothetical protein